MDQVGDFGPIYTETNLAQFPVEPFNTFSNLFFLIVIIYWFKKRKSIGDKNFKVFLNICLPILLVGYIGGTIYHATRSHSLWLILDFVPIFVLAIIVSLYMWKKIVQSYLLIFAFMVGLIVIPRSILLYFFYESPYKITLGYVLLSVPILIPTFIHESKRQWLGKRDLFLTLACLVVAISFRALDSSHFVQSFVPMGTHWLWHSFGGVTTHLLLIYIYKNTIGLD